MSISLEDWRGNPIVPGSIVVYPGRHSSHMWMVEAEVISVEEEEYGYYPTKKRTVLRVQPLKQGRYFRIDMKPTKLTAIERVTVVPQCPKSMAQVMEESAGG